MKIVIITHHKTGTQLWGSLFKTLGKIYDWKIIKIPSKDQREKLKLINEENWDICHFTNGIKNLDALETLDKYNYRCLHSIRNPANIIVSAAKYHKRGSEKWLTKKKEIFKNMSYQEKISSFDNDQDELIWEMNNISKENIKNMMSIIRLNKINFRHIDLDYVSFDKRMVEYNNLYFFLKLDQIKKNQSKQIFLTHWVNQGYKHLLWNFENRKENKGILTTLKKHVTRENCEGLLDNRFMFKDKAKNEFRKIFGEIIYTYTFH